MNNNWFEEESKKMNKSMKKTIATGFLLYILFGALWLSGVGAMIYFVFYLLNKYGVIGG